jgi:hypothetical protein
MPRQLFEGARKRDLDFLIKRKIHFDEYDSKMGSNDSVVTASFKIRQKEPALDLVSFMENGYDWVLDADISTGEIGDGEYLVFLEMQRRSDLADCFMEMIEDLQHLTNIKPSDWKFRWYKQDNYVELDREKLRENVPLSPKRYKEAIEGYAVIKEATKDLLPDIKELKRLSGIK